MTEVVKHESTDLVLPWTGEVFDTTRPEQVAAAYVAILDVVAHVDDVRKLVVSLLWEEGERQGTKTLHYDGFDVVLTTYERVEWDFEKLRDRLAEAGLPGERIDRLIKTVVTQKVDAAVARQLRATNQAYADALDASSEIGYSSRNARLER